MSASPSAQQLFGNAPWVTDPAPGGNGPAGPYLYNNTSFATRETAAVVLQIVILGCALKPEDAAKCIVLEDPDAMTGGPGPFKQNQPNLMIQMPDGSKHFAGLIALEFLNWHSIEPINSELSQEFGMPFNFVMPPPPAAAVMKPVPGHQLLFAPIGGTAVQADGTTWKRVS